jgi:hypothetical protein
MRIYLDESKRLWDWKIVFGWFMTKHSHSYVEKFIYNKKLKYNIKNDFELKWTKRAWKYFYEKMLKDNTFEILENLITGIYIKWYYKDNLDLYKKIITNLLFRHINYFKNYNKDILIIADIVNLWNNNSLLEKAFEKYLHENLSISSKIKFNFANSKTNLSIQLSDLISYKLWKNYFFWEYLDDFILENTFNIDINKEFEI